LTGIQIADGRSPVVKGTTCHMHTQELVVSHALGIKERTKRNQVVDSFVMSKELRIRVKKLLSKIMNKQAKGRFCEFNKISKEFLHCKANKLELPNETRVSGTYKMYVSALRSKKLIILFLNNSKEKQTFQDETLSDEEWQFIAECEAVLRTANVLAMKSQSDSATSNVLSYFYVAKTRAIIQRIKTLRVYDLNESWTPKTPVEDIKMIPIKFDDLMEETKLLIKRLVSEFNRYFPHPDTDQLLMMMLHPIMIRMGFR
jgi:hypothetical protein